MTRKDEEVIELSEQSDIDYLKLGIPVFIFCPVTSHVFYFKTTRFEDKS